MNGPEITLINNNDLNLSTGENVIGVRRTIKDHTNTGFELIISGPIEESQKRILKVDNNGIPSQTGFNTTINPTDLKYKLLELNTGIDLDGDEKYGFSITQSDVANQEVHNELNRRVSLTSDNEIILSRDSLPTGDINKDNLTSSFLRYDNWNGPGVIVLADTNGDNSFKNDNSQTILGARVIRTDEIAPLSPPRVERAEIFVSSQNKTQVIKFELDGTNSGIATYLGTEELGTSQIKSVELETGFKLDGDNSASRTIDSILYNPSNSSRPSSEQDRFVGKTLDGEIVLSRETINVGSEVSTNNSANRPIILKDKNGNPINSSDLNSSASNKFRLARYF